MNGLLLPVQFENIATRKDKTIKIILGTQELSPDKGGQLFALNQHMGFAYFSDQTINPQDADVIDTLEPDRQDSPGRSQSQRIRDLYRVLYEQAGEGYKDFGAYYYAKTEKIIEHLKTKIK
jgi:hypothetical protein